MSTFELDYQPLLKQTDLLAFKGALNQVLAIDIDHWLSMNFATIGTPAPADWSTDDPLLTAVPVKYSNPYQDPIAEPMAYRRLELGAYMDCCLRYLKQSDIATVDALCAWFMSVHGLYFADTAISFTASIDPKDSAQTLVTVTVTDGNYVWVGNVILYQVADNSLRLLAYPGVARGLQWADVLTSST